MCITVRVPATTANLGPGFDVIGLALSLYNEVEMDVLPRGLQIELSGEGADWIARDESNLVYQAADRVFQAAGQRPSGLKIHLRNRIPVTRGLGSSSAALVGGLVAANELIGRPLATEDLFELACELEGHPDNVAPALFGGLVVSARVQNVWRKVLLQPPRHLQAVAVVPDFVLPTSLARDAVPQSFSREVTVFTSSHVGLMIAALLQDDLALFGAAMEDRLHQPFRAGLIPGMNDVLEAALEAGALGVALSGAGPTVIAFTDHPGSEIGEAMQSAFAEYGVACTILPLQPDLRGAHVVPSTAPLRR